MKTSSTPTMTASDGFAGSLEPCLTRALQVGWKEGDSGNLNLVNKETRSLPVVSARELLLFLKVYGKEYLCEAVTLFLCYLSVSLHHLRPL